MLLMLYAVFAFPVQEYSDCVLTYLGSKYGSDEIQVKNEEEGVKSGQRFYVAACSRIDNQKKAQRFVLDHPSLITSDLSYLISEHGN